jgi:hypothetical protein
MGLKKKKRNAEIHPANTEVVVQRADIIKENSPKTIKEEPH